MYYSRSRKCRIRDTKEKFRYFQGSRPDFSPGANPNPPIPVKICVLKHDWFAATSIQLLSFCYSAKRKCPCDAWQILRLATVFLERKLIPGMKFSFKTSCFIVSSTYTSLSSMLRREMLRELKNGC